MKKSVIVLAMLFMVMMMTNVFAEGDTQNMFSNDAPGNSAVQTFPAPSSQGGSYGLGTRTLRLSSPYMRGSDVRTLQRMLNALGYRCGYPDGLYGNKTMAAVKSFQRRNGLTADGVFGWRTRTLLLRVYRESR